MSGVAPLESALSKLDLEVERPAIDRLQAYIDTLLHWNARMNLTSLGGDELARRLVAEPLWVARALGVDGRFLDIGSGNGSPAFPWLIRGGFAGADLVESRQRRAVFLKRMARTLGLDGVQVHAMRFEEFRPTEPAAWVTLQGVRLTTKLRQAIESALPDARIVWFTRDPDAAGTPARTLKIPHSDRCALVFRA